MPLVTIKTSVLFGLIFFLLSWKKSQKEIVNAKGYLFCMIFIAIAFSNVYLTLKITKAHHLKCFSAEAARK